VAAGNPLRVGLAVTDHGPAGSRARVYRLSAALDGHKPVVFATRAVAPGQTWNYAAAIPVPADGSLHRLVFLAQSTPAGTRPLTVGVYFIGVRR
jgi:hypothetical protein